MSAGAAETLVKALKGVADPRKRRGVRHPCSGILVLVFMGCLCRLSEMAVLQRWASRHWKTIAKPLGFHRSAPPHATTMSRVLAKTPLNDLEEAFAAWLVDALRDASLDACAVDGKTSKQALDAEGDPIHTLNVFVEDLKVCLGQWQTGNDKATEPEVLKAHLEELLERYPGLNLFSGDALFCQRPLAELIVNASRRYLLAVKDNQPDMMEAMHTTFDQIDEAKPQAKSVEKRGRR
jgi:hypothetical protein